MSNIVQSFVDRITESWRESVQKILQTSEILVESEKEIVEDLIIAAFSDAKSKINDEVAKKMKEITGGLPLPPGFNLGF